MAFSYPHLLLNLQPVLDWMPPEKNNNSFQLWILPFVIRFESPSQRRGFSFSVFPQGEKGSGRQSRSSAALNASPMHSMQLCLLPRTRPCPALATRPRAWNPEMLKCHLHCGLGWKTAVIHKGDWKCSWWGGLAGGWIKRRSLQWMLTRANGKLTPQPFAHPPSSTSLSKWVFSFITKLEAKNCFPLPKVGSCPSP